MLSGVVQPPLGYRIHRCPRGIWSHFSVLQVVLSPTTCSGIAMDAQEVAANVDRLQQPVDELTRTLRSEYFFRRPNTYPRIDIRRRPHRSPSGPRFVKCRWTIARPAQRRADGGCLLGRLQSFKHIDSIGPVKSVHGSVRYLFLIGMSTSLNDSRVDLNEVKSSEGAIRQATVSNAVRIRRLLSGRFTKVAMTISLLPY